jgi:hypothetical protein
MIVEGNSPEPALHRIQPTGTGENKMHPEAQMVATNFAPLRVWENRGVE